MITQGEDHYRLHQVPFFLMWVAAFGISYLVLFVAAIMWSDIAWLRSISYWLNTFGNWGYGLLIGSILGIQLATVQAWLIRRRYGFVPRFWRITTFIGMLFSGVFLTQVMNQMDYNSYDGFIFNIEQYGVVFLWSFALTAIQCLSLWTVARRAGLYLLAGLGASLIAIASALLAPNELRQLNMLFFGAVAQAVFSALGVLWLMRDYRTDAVPKNDEKAKLTPRANLHSMSFVGLWGMAHLVGWVLLGSLVFMLILITESFPIMDDLMRWLSNQQAILYTLMGLIVGTGTALAQPWLMQQRNGYRPRFWLPVSIIAWGIAGLGFWQFITNYSPYSFGEFVDTRIIDLLMLLVWFGIPSLFQAFLLWRDYKAGWLYALAGVSSAVIAYLINLQFAWTYNEDLYAIMLGAIVQAILTAVAYLFISQQGRREHPDTV